MHMPIQNTVYLKPVCFLHCQTKLFMVTWVGERIYLTREVPEGLGGQEVHCSCLLIGPGIGKWFEELFSVADGQSRSSAIGCSVAAWHKGKACGVGMCEKVLQ